MHKDKFDFVVVATGLFNQPLRPEWAEGLVRPTPPPSGPWVVDARDFTDEAAAKVRSRLGCLRLPHAAPYPPMRSSMSKILTQAREADRS